MSFRVALGALGLAALALLAGCRTAPPTAVIGPGPGAEASWPEQYTQLAAVNTYSLTGRVAVAANGQGFTANLRYRQDPGSSNIALDGPLGIGGLRIALEGKDLRISTSRGEQLDGDAARAELETRLGFAMPIEELRWWLLGVPAPGPAERHQADGTGEIRDFTQNGWHVSINTRAEGLGFSLPQRLTAEREGARLKLLVERWQP